MTEIYAPRVAADLKRLAKQLLTISDDLRNGVIDIQAADWQTWELIEKFGDWPNNGPASK
jgi:hypothetical protein